MKLLIIMFNVYDCTCTTANVRLYMRKCILFILRCYALMSSLTINKPAVLHCARLLRYRQLGECQQLRPELRVLFRDCLLTLCDGRFAAAKDSHPLPAGDLLLQGYLCAPRGNILYIFGSLTIVLKYVLPVTRYVAVLRLQIYVLLCCSANSTCCADKFVCCIALLIRRVAPITLRVRMLGRQIFIALIRYFSTITLRVCVCLAGAAHRRVPGVPRAVRLDGPTVFPSDPHRGLVARYWHLSEPLRHQHDYHNLPLPAHGTRQCAHHLVSATFQDAH